MKMENGFVIMTRDEIASMNIKQRIVHALEGFGPLTAIQMSRLCCGGTIGERSGRISRACYSLARDGMIEKNSDRVWRLVE